MKFIIVKKPDKGVIRICPNHQKYGPGKIPYEQLPALQEYIDLGWPWRVINTYEFPSKQGLESRCQIYHENDELKIDSDWNKRLMPCNIIAKRELADLELELDNEYTSLISSSSKIKNLKNKIKKAKLWEFNPTKEMYETAKNRLDNSPKEKPNIEEMLAEKIAQLALEE